MKSKKKDDLKQLDEAEKIVKDFIIKTLNKNKIYKKFESRVDLKRKTIKAKE